MTAAVLSPPSQTATRVRFIQHAGASILLIDLSNLADAAMVLAEIRTARDLASRQPPDSLRTLTLVRGAPHSPVLMDALWELGGRSKANVRAGAVVGMEGVSRVLYRAVMRFSGRNMEAFEELEPALEWLTAQA